MQLFRGSAAILVLCCWLLPSRAHAYSVLTHEAIVDAVWDSSMRPLLLARFPRATPEELRNAHAMAYGGALMPDMGYFPAGSPFFTNLVHYVRSGDFVSTLLREARSLDELAFALGALSHYNADRWGHPLGTNRVVPILYPKAAAGAKTLSYEDDPIAHKRVEFGFDVLQTARGNYAAAAYHDFIGFCFADSLLKRCFREVYGLPLDDVFGNFDRAVSLLRFSVRDIFPLLTRAAWQNRRKEIREKTPGATARSFRYRMQRKHYQQLYGSSAEKPRFFERVFAGIVFILPKVGPLKPLKFKVPDRTTEKIFVASFDTVTKHLQQSIALLQKGTKPALANYDFDTGLRTEPGEYRLADGTYRCLLKNLQKDGFRAMTPALRQNVLSFFSKGEEQRPAGDDTALQAAFTELQHM
ncbi:zinc dependent phospholipase C family protein [Flaviaesturariibacter terrae]